MTLAKAVVTGTVFRTPEKRFTQNNIAVYSLILNIGDKDETLMRVISKRNSLASVLDSVSKGEKLLVEGRLQTANVKMEDGAERKIFEIEANAIEKMSCDSASNSNSSSNGEISKFAEEEFSEELIGEEEIPF